MNKSFANDSLNRIAIIGCGHTRAIIDRPTPSTIILIAIAAAMGIPFVISTPPNAMVYGEGVKSSELLIPGLILMLLGCLLISLTCPFILRIMGIP